MRAGRAGAAGQAGWVAWLVFILGIVSISMSAQTPSAVRTIEKGTHSNVDDARQAVARNDAEWLVLWRSHNFDKPAPKIDFAKEMAVAVFMGSRPTAGFGVEIVSAAERGGTLVVGYRETMPARDALTAQIVTSPYHVAAIPKSAAEVVFEKAP